MSDSGVDWYDHTARFYDAFPAYATRPDVGFYVEEAKDSGGPVLELGCGTGRILIPTARAGLEVTGLDLSQEMLTHCRGHLEGEAPEVRERVTLQVGDMRDFSLGSRFALVTMPFRAFQHLLTVEEQLACLKCIREHLAERGRLAFDVFNPSLPALVDDARMEEHPDGEPLTMPTGERVQRKVRIPIYDPFEQTQDVEFVYEVTHTDGRQERLVDRFPMRYIFRFELEHLLVRAGFSMQALYADFDHSPFGSTYPGELIVIATTTPRTHPL